MDPVEYVAAVAGQFSSAGYQIIITVSAPLEEVQRETNFTQHGFYVRGWYIVGLEISRISTLCDGRSMDNCYIEWYYSLPSRSRYLWLVGQLSLAPFPIWMKDLIIRLTVDGLTFVLKLRSEK
jgi:hypothetical protein